MPTTLLIVDDEPEILSLLSVKLAKPDRKIITASSGYEAMDHVQEEAIDLVITDYHMKNGDGGSLAHFCTNMKVPCMVLSAFDDGKGNVAPYLPKNVHVYSKLNCFDSHSFEDQVDAMIGSAVKRDDEGTIIKMLMLDDDEDDFVILKRLLSGIDEPRYELTHCADIDVALSEMSSNRYDGYIVDYKLGPESGLNVLRKAKQMGCNRPIFLLTGNASDKLDRQAMLSGADDFINKNDLDIKVVDRSIRYSIERRRQERAISEQQLKLSQVLRLSTIGKMTSSITHEIKNPMAIISGKAQLMRRKLRAGLENKEEFDQNLGVIIESISRMVQIINGMQNFSRESDDHQYEEIAIQEVVKDAVAFGRTLPKAKNVKITCEDIDESLTAECRPVEIEQVLLNLISNAVDAIENQEEKWIKVTAHDMGNEVSIKCTDSGHGIPKDLHEAILTPFFTTKERNKGTGLGLSICKTIVESHSGSLKVDDSVSNTCFEIVLPKKIGMAKRESSEPRTSVLVVDDDVDFVKLTSSELSRMCPTLEIFEAYDGDYALELISMHHINIVVIDVVMPGLNGVEFYKQLISQLKGHSPEVIFVSGYENVNIPSEIKASSTRFLTKPFIIDDLLGEISACMGRKMAG